MIAQPFNGFPMFLMGAFHYLNNCIRRLTKFLGDQFAEVVVVSILQLIFDNNFSFCPRFTSKDIDTKISYGRFHLIDGNIQSPTASVRRAMLSSCDSHGVKSKASCDHTVLKSFISSSLPKFTYSIPFQI